jgi:hypothetical protein
LGDHGDHESIQFQQSMSKRRPSRTSKPAPISSDDRALFLDAIGEVDPVRGQDAPLPDGPKPPPRPRPQADF